MQNEENSRFKNHAVLNDRYLLLSLLGKGGFRWVLWDWVTDGCALVAVKCGTRSTWKMPSMSPVKYIMSIKIGKRTKKLIMSSEFFYSIFS